MRRSFWALCFAGAALPLMVSGAQAACTRANLAGLWDAYAIGVEDGAPYWTRGSISFSSTARILSGNLCRQDTGAGSTLSGRLRVNSDCSVTGSFTQHFNAGGSAACGLPQATLSTDKESVTGVGKCNSGAAIFTFSMVKR